MYLYKFRDYEEDTAENERTLITEEDVTELIKDSCFAWDDCLCFNTIEEHLKKNGEELQYNEKVLKFLEKHKDKNIDEWFKIDFVKDILRENNIKVLEFNEKIIWY